MRRIPALAVAALALGAAACSSSSSGGLGTAGTGSPSAALSGFIGGLVNSNPATACTFVAPNQQSECNKGFANASLKTSGLGLGNTFTDGSQAIQVVTASSFCLGVGAAPTTTTCLSNSNKNAGLPSSDAGFAAALATTFSSSSSPDTACVDINGAWYVELAPGGGPATSTSTGATGATGPTGGSTTSSTPAGATGPTGGASTTSS